MTTRASSDALRLYFCGLLFFAASYILGASYLGINGNHSWRQADVYSHILGFQGAQNLAPLMNFLGATTPYDFPIYTYGIAGISTMLDAAPLVVVRNVNFIALLVTLIYGFKLLRHLFGLTAGAVYVSLIATSRLILHYFSVPLPDVLAIAASLFGFACLLIEHRRLYVLAGILSLLTAAVIKSPVAFPFVLALACIAPFYAPPNTTPRQFAVRIAIVCILSLAGAVGSELWRAETLHQGPALVDGSRWYFGNLDLRLSAEFWTTFLARINSWGPPLFGQFLTLATGVFLLRRIPVLNKRLMTALLVASILPWLVFSNLYFVHDYYAMPSAIFASMFVAAAVGSMAQHVVPASRYTGYLSIAIGTIFLVSQALTILDHPLGERTRLSKWSAMELLIPQSTEVLVAHTGVDSPTIGGQLSRKTRMISPEQLEGHCDRYMAAYAAIVAPSSSSCLRKHRLDAGALISLDGLTLFVAPTEQ